MNVVGSVLEALTVTKARLVLESSSSEGPSLGQKALAAVASAVGISAGGGSDTEVVFKFNPTQYVVSRGAQYDRPRAAAGAVLPKFAQYLSPNPQTLRLDIFFDDYESVNGDVTKDVQKLLDWTRPKSGEQTPPLLKFIWGDHKAITEFKGFLTTVTATYTMFRIDGTPVRATANITLEEQGPPEPNPSPDGPPTNPTSGAIHSRKTHLLREGETLHSIAFREYGKPAYWRALATFNEIDDPLAVEAGTAILIPSAAEAARLI